MRNFYFFFVLIVGSAFSQNDTTSIVNNIAFKYSCHRGHVLKNYNTQIPLKNSLYNEVSVLWQMDGRRKWHAPFKYPLSGVTLNYAQFGNDTILGNAIGLFPHWIIQGRKGKSLQYNFRLGVGLAYFTEKYDRLNNAENELVSSFIANITTIGVSLSYFFTKNLSLFAGTSIFHYSNAHTDIPNMGLNDRVVSLGLMYKPQASKLHPRVSFNDDDRDIHLNFRIGRGIHEMAGSTFPNGGPSYPVYNFATYLSKKISEINELHLGAYLSYYSGYYHFMLLEQMKQGEELKNSFVYSVFTGHEFLVSHFGFTQELLFNVWSPFNKERNFDGIYASQAQMTKLEFYLGLRLQVDYYPFKPSWQDKNVYIGSSLKTLGSKADYFEMHVGYSL